MRKTREVTGAKRGENGTVLMYRLAPSKKGEFFCSGEVFFLLTGPLMGDPLTKHFFRNADATFTFLGARFLIKQMCKEFSNG